MKKQIKRAAAAQPLAQKGFSIPPIMELIIFSMCLILIFLGIFQTIYKTPYSATGIYFDFASKVIHGQIPYRDFSLEYPPLALIFFIIPRLFADGWPLFSILYQVEVMVFAIIGAAVIYKIARRLGKPSWKLLLPYVIGILAIGPITGQQYDMFPAVLMLLSLYFFWTGKHKTSWLFLALGTLTKIYPFVIAPIYLIYYWKNRQFKPLVSGILVFATACLIVLLPFLVISPSSLLSLVNYHSQRGLQIESSYSSILLIADKLGLTSIKLSFNYGSWNLGGTVAALWSKYSIYVMGLGLLAAYGFIYRQIKIGKSQFTRLGAYCVLVITVLLITSKIFSPQYIIWLLPAVVLVLNRWKSTITLLFITIGVLTYLIFPLYYLDLVYLKPFGVVLLFVRDLFLLILGIAAVVSLRKMKSSE